MKIIILVGKTTPSVRILEEMKSISKYERRCSSVESIVSKSTLSPRKMLPVESLRIGKLFTGQNLLESGNCLPGRISWNRETVYQAESLGIGKLFTGQNLLESGQCSPV